jgi:hypothetical protein
MRHTRGKRRTSVEDSTTVAAERVGGKALHLVTFRLIVIENNGTYHGPSLCNSVDIEASCAFGIDGTPRSNGGNLYVGTGIDELNIGELCLDRGAKK